MNLEKKLPHLPRKNRHIHTINKSKGDLVNRDELKNISQMRDLNHQKISQIEEQISKLDQVIQEHESVFRSLTQLGKSEDSDDGMVPIGAGIQIPIKYTNVKSTIIDIGSGIHAEKSIGETINLIGTRIDELKILIDQLVEEHSTTSNTIKELTAKLEDAISTQQSANQKESKSSEQQKPTESKSPKKKRRRFGGELTLDD